MLYFLTGVTSSGKSFVAQGLFGIPKKINVSAYGLKLVNQDSELERMLKKYGFGLDLDDMPEELFSLHVKYNVRRIKQNVLIPHLYCNSLKLTL